jgi:hypothetical protein
MLEMFKGKTNERPPRKSETTDSGDPAP